MFDTPGSNRDRREGYHRNHRFRVERRERARWCPGTRTRSPRRRSTRRGASDAARGGTRRKPPPRRAGWSIEGHRPGRRPSSRRRRRTASRDRARPPRAPRGRTTTSPPREPRPNTRLTLCAPPRRLRRRRTPREPRRSRWDRRAASPCRAFEGSSDVAPAIDRASSIAARIAAVCDGPFGAVSDELRRPGSPPRPRRSSPVRPRETARSRRLERAEGRTIRSDTPPLERTRRRPRRGSCTAPRGEHPRRSENFRDVRREEDVDAHHRRAVRRRVRTRAASVLPRNLRRDERGRTRGVERDGGSAKVEEKRRATRRCDGREKTTPSPRATTTRPRRSRRRLARDRSLDSRYPRRHPFDSP